MKKIIFGLLLSALFFVNLSAQNEAGKAIFESKGCTLCHKIDMDTIGPSLTTIKNAYTGQESSLVSYLKSQGTAIVEPARAAVMNPQLVKIKTLFDEDIKALAEYIISAADRPAMKFK